MISRSSFRILQLAGPAYAGAQDVILPASTAVSGAVMIEGIACRTDAESRA
jgi:hypothetical protein